MKKFRLIANSTIDETADYYKSHEIGCACLSFTLDGRTVKEDFGATVPYHEFFDRLRAGSLSTTSQAQLGDYLTLFREACAEGLDVLYLGFSSGLSGSYQAGCMAAEEIRAAFPKRTIRCVDTLCAAGGEAVLIDHAWRLRDAGKSADECADEIERMKLHVLHLVTVDDLNHLWRGGRVSRTSAVLGTLVGIKPVIFLDNEGKLEVCHKIRGRKQSLEHLGDEMIAQVDRCARKLLDAGKPEEAEALRRQTLRISHGDCEQDAEQLAGYLRAHGLPNIAIRPIDTVIGSHTGPGVIALFGLGEERRPF